MELKERHKMPKSDRGGWVSGSENADRASNLFGNKEIAVN